MSSASGFPTSSSSSNTPPPVSSSHTPAGPSAPSRRRKGMRQMTSHENVHKVREVASAPLESRSADAPPTQKKIKVRRGEQSGSEITTETLRESLFGVGMTPLDSAHSLFLDVSSTLCSRALKERGNNYTSGEIKRFLRDLTSCETDRQRLECCKNYIPLIQDLRTASDDNTDNLLSFFTLRTSANWLMSQDVLQLETSMLKAALDEAIGFARNARLYGAGSSTETNDIPVVAIDRTATKPTISSVSQIFTDILDRNNIVYNKGEIQRFANFIAQYHSSPDCFRGLNAVSYKPETVFAINFLRQVLGDSERYGNLLTEVITSRVNGLSPADAQSVDDILSISFPEVLGKVLIDVHFESKKPQSSSSTNDAQTLQQGADYETYVNFMEGVSKNLKLLREELQKPEPKIKPLQSTLTIMLRNYLSLQGLNMPIVLRDIDDFRKLVDLIKEGLMIKDQDVPVLQDILLAFDDAKVNRTFSLVDTSKVQEFRSSVPFELLDIIDQNRILNAEMNKIIKETQMDPYKGLSILSRFQREHRNMMDTHRKVLLKTHFERFLDTSTWGEAALQNPRDPVIDGLKKQITKLLEKTDREDVRRGIRSILSDFFKHKGIQTPFYFDTEEDFDKFVNLIASDLGIPENRMKRFKDLLIRVQKTPAGEMYFPFIDYSSWETLERKKIPDNIRNIGNIGAVPERPVGSTVPKSFPVTGFEALYNYLNRSESASDVTSAIKFINSRLEIRNPLMDQLLLDKSVGAIDQFDSRYLEEQKLIDRAILDRKWKNPEEILARVWVDKGSGSIILKALVEGGDFVGPQQPIRPPVIGLRAFKACLTHVVNNDIPIAQKMILIKRLVDWLKFEHYPKLIMSEELRNVARQIVKHIEAEYQKELDLFINSFSFDSSPPAMSSENVSTPANEPIPILKLTLELDELLTSTMKEAQKSETQKTRSPSLNIEQELELADMKSEKGSLSLAGKLRNESTERFLQLDLTDLVSTPNGPTVSNIVQYTNETINAFQKFLQKGFPVGKRDELVAYLNGSDKVKNQLASRIKFTLAVADKLLRDGDICTYYAIINATGAIMPVIELYLEGKPTHSRFRALYEKLKTHSENISREKSYQKIRELNAEANKRYQVLTPAEKRKLGGPVPAINYYLSDLTFTYDGNPVFKDSGAGLEINQAASELEYKSIQGITLALEAAKETRAKKNEGAD